MGANSAVTANGKDLATKYNPNNTNPAVYKESHTFETGGRVFFYCNPEAFDARVAAFAAKAAAKPAEAKVAEIYIWRKLNHALYP